MINDPVCKHVYLDPQEILHANVLNWLVSQNGSDNENLIYLMIQGLKLITDEISPSVADSQPTKISQENQEMTDEEIQKKTQEFIIGMADNFG